MPSDKPPGESSLTGRVLTRSVPAVWFFDDRGEDRRQLAPAIGASSSSSSSAMTAASRMRSWRTSVISQS